LKVEQIHRLYNNIKEISGPFRLSDLIDQPDDLEVFLEESGLFFWTFDNWGSRQYLLKEFFFNGAVFSIHLVKAEVAKKVLCAPSRFLPFTDKLLPLFIDGKEVSLNSTKVSLSCLQSVYCVDKGQRLISFMETAEGRDFTSLQEVSKCHIPTYDLSSINIAPGAHMRVSLGEDCLIADIFCSEEINLLEIREWNQEMEKSLKGILDEFGPITNIYTQLEQAYFYGPELLRKQNSPAIRDFVKMSKELEIIDFVFRRIIWKKGVSPINSTQLKKEASQVIRELRKPHVSPFFASYLSEDMQPHFRCGRKIPVMKEDTNQIALVIRKVALWLINNRKFLIVEEVPIEETLMFYSAFSDLQRICELFHKEEVTISEDLYMSFQMNSEIIRELMEYLQVSFTSE
jgi:hypothetical protein